MRWIAITCILTLVSMLAYAAQKVVLYSDQENPPYAFVENGQSTGIYSELIRRAALRLAPEYEVEILPIGWKEGLAAVEHGRVMGLIGVYMRPERLYMQPYSVPLFRESAVLLCHNTLFNRPRKQFPVDFIGITVANNQGFLMSEQLMAAVKAGQIKLEDARGNETNVQKLNQHQVDCYTNDRLAILYTVKQLQRSGALTQFYAHEALELSSENTYIGYTRYDFPYKADFITKLNAAIQAEQKLNAVDKLIALYTH